MTLKKPASLKRIEERMQGLTQDSTRYQVLDSCRRFKNSWIELGQALFSVQRDKLYREWEYLTFEDYCHKELGIKKPTAMKLLKSYEFLETEEPSYIQEAQETEPEAGRKYPDLDSVNLLRLVKSNKKIAPESYDKIRKKVLDDAQEVPEVRRELRMLLQDQGKSPQEARSDRRAAYLKGLIRGLKDARQEGMAARFLPPDLLDQLEELIEKIEKESVR